MARAILGNHSAIVLPRAEQDRIRRFYRDVLGCEIIRENEQKDDFRMGDNFYIGVLYEDESVAHARRLFAAWLEHVVGLTPPAAAAAPAATDRPA